jgi:hypothetical protein
MKRIKKRNKDHTNIRDINTGDVLYDKQHDTNIYIEANKIQVM